MVLKKDEAMVVMNTNPIFHSANSGRYVVKQTNEAYNSQTLQACAEPSHPVSGKAHKKEDRSDKNQFLNPLNSAAYTKTKAPKWIR